MLIFLCCWLEFFISSFFFSAWFCFLFFFCRSKPQFDDDDNMESVVCNFYCGSFFICSDFCAQLYLACVTNSDNRVSVMHSQRNRQCWPQLSRLLSLPTWIVFDSLLVYTDLNNEKGVLRNDNRCIPFFISRFWIFNIHHCSVTRWKPIIGIDEINCQETITHNSFVSFVMSTQNFYQNR